MTLASFGYLALGGACGMAGISACYWLINRGEQRRHDQGRCRDPQSGRC